ncbi:MAG: hypothetical protein KF817_14450 [Phycisphaeraceae bacterium]|nr:hypothetical protein [Phycisphaeraceae bacterium]
MKRRERANPGIPRHLDQAAGSAADAARHAALRDDPVPLALYGDGADEATRAQMPLACRDIDQVMAAQRSLVDTLGRFDPATVRMAPDGEAPED